VSTPKYIGIFLTPRSRRELLRDFPPVHDEVHADHVTIHHDLGGVDLEGIDLGSVVTFRVAGYAEDRRGQAVTVILPREIAELVKDRVPHVTISTERGTPPAYSKELLARGARPVPPQTYTGILDAWPRRSPVHTRFFPLASRVADSWLRRRLRSYSRQ